MKECQPILAIYDVSGIQEYIFSSNKLRENIGASKIVSEVLDKLLPEELESVINGPVITNWVDAETFQFIDDYQIQAEIIYNGGGSTVVAYRNQFLYDEVNRAFAKHLIETSYLLTLATACVETKFTNYSEDISKLANQLENVKARMLRQRPMGALPITEQEALTGLPVTQQYKNENISTVQMFKRQVADRENEKNKNGEAIFAFEMEDLISCKGEDGYVAVVHIDGNGMGQSIQKEIKSFSDYEHAVRKMRSLSKDISQIYQNVFDQLTQDLKEIMLTEGFSFDPILRDNKPILPIRSIIFGGDDVTFICNGRLGVPLAAAFLRRLALVPNPPISLSACAGVALVHSHFPFNIAYEIAESCCSDAKKERHTKKDQEGYIDFHLARGGYERESNDSQRNVKSLQTRPFRVTPDPCQDQQSFDRLNDIIGHLPAPDSNFVEGQWPRSRLKKLYESCLGEPQQIDHSLNEFASRGYQLSSLTGQKKEIGPLFDALELMDLFERNLFSALCETKTKEECK